MADTPVTDVNGLQLSNNTFSASPPGSLQRADNVVMPQKGVAEPRRGQARAYTPPATNQIPFAQAEFRGSLIINSATAKTDDFTLGIAAVPTVDFAGGPWTPVDSTADAGAPAMKFGFAGTFMHFCTTTGPKTLETLSDVPRAAGLLRMPDCTAVWLDPATAPSGPIPYNSSVAYRSVLRLPVDGGGYLLSPPSGRLVVTNTIIAPIGTLHRAAGTTVTATLPGSSNPGVAIGTTFTLDPGEADFPAAGPTAGHYVVGSVAGNVVVYPSAGANVTNTVQQSLNVGARAVELQINLSPDATEETPVRLYRSRPTSTATVQPSDEMFLVNEVFPSASDIINGYIIYVDQTPDSVINEPLYTNPQTGEGPTQANYPPPLYRDTTNWGQRQWYAQTTGPQTFNLQMLGVGSPDGVQNNDTITFSVPGEAGTPYVFTFKNSPGVATDVQIFSYGEPSFNIEHTAQDLVRAINEELVFDGTPLRAYYNSAEDESPGKILLQRTDIVQSASTENGRFSAIASRPASWVPALDSATETWSNDEYQPNGLAYSKLGLAEAVPPVNYTNIGAKNYPIARIVGLKNALLVFKRGDGVYSVTGQYPFQVLQVSTANIIAPDACSVLADNAWAYTDQGFLRLSDSGGTEVISRPIETELNRLRDESPAMTSLYSFTVPYETERRIMLFVPFSGDDTASPPTLTLKAWVYNNATQAWTGPLDYGQPFSGTVGLIASRLTLGVYDALWATGRVTSERKGNGYLDYADASFSNTISAVDVGGNPLVLRLSSGNDIEAGDGIIQGQWATKIRTLRPDLGRRYVEVYEDVPFTAAACTIYKHYDMALQFLPQGTPTSRRVLTRLQLLFKPEQFATFGGNTILLTDQLQADLEVATTSLGFGLTPFGQGPFGNPTPMTVDVNPISAPWASASQFFIGFELAEVWPKFRLQGIGAAIDNATGPAGRGK